MDELDDVADRTVRRETCRLPVAAAARRAGDCRNVDLVVRRAQRDAPCRPFVARRLADQRDHVGALDGAQVVDDPLRVRLLRADVAEVVLEQERDHEPPALEELRAFQGTGEQLQLGELHRLVDVPEDPVHVGARLDELRREAQGLRRRVRVLEASGVGDDPDVERGGDLGAQRHVELAQDVPDDLGGRRRFIHDQVHVAEPGVVVVVVDVDDQLRALDRVRFRADPALVRAVDRDEHALFHVGRQLAADAGQVEEAVLAGRRRVTRQVHDDVLAERAQAERQRQHRPEGVPVRVLVGGDDEQRVGADRVCDLLKLTLRVRLAHLRAAPPQARRSASSFGRPARPIHRKRTRASASCASSAAG